MVMAALQALADRLGVHPAPHRRPDGRPRWTFLLIGGLASLCLWIGVGWGLVRLVGGLVEAR